MPLPLAVKTLDDFVYGRAPHPLRCGRGVELGRGRVIPEINFTLPPLDVNETTWPEIRRQYEQMIEGVCQRALELEVPALLVEFETLPEMTVRPHWGLEIVRLLADTLRRYSEKRGLPNALRVTPSDIREFERPPRLREGKFWESMVEFFEQAGEAGADLLAIESTGGKEVSDAALMSADLRGVVWALGVLGARDMAFLWDEIVAACRRSGIVPAGDTACGFANTAMVLAEQKLLPSVFAALVRVAAAPRSLIAFQRGAQGPSKDCAYEGPYLKALAGIPISMEGKSAACAHLSPVGNIAAAVCDAWSNESVQNVRLLSGPAPTASLEQLAYDCRLMNAAGSQSPGEALRLRDWLIESDAARNPQAWVLRPDVVLHIAAEIAQEPTPYTQTRRAVGAAIQEMRRASAAGELRLPERELPWLDRFEEQAESLPADEGQFCDEMMQTPLADKFTPEQYGLAGGRRAAA